MRTTIDSYKARAGRLDLDGIEFGDFRDQPLAPDALRSLRYMHDIEHHTVCYLRDLLLTPAHRDPAITSFLSCWALLFLVQTTRISTMPTARRCSFCSDHGEYWRTCVNREKVGQQRFSRLISSCEAKK